MNSFMVVTPIDIWYEELASSFRQLVFQPAPRHEHVLLSSMLHVLLVQLQTYQGVGWYSHPRIVQSTIPSCGGWVNIVATIVAWYIKYFLDI